MLHAGHGSDIIDMVFDVYPADSIKSAESIQRGSTEGIACSNKMPGHKIKNWRQLLSCTESKNKLIAFLAESWKERKFRENLGRKCMFVNSSDRCIKLIESGWQEIDDLQSTQEEADMRILLHAKHAAETIPELICITEDTYVFIICLGLCQDVNSNIFIRRGSKSSVRLVDITKLAAVLGRDVCTSMLGLHPWTGCDTISAFAGQGKLKALKILLREQKFIDAFEHLGIAGTLQMSCSASSKSLFVHSTVATPKSLKSMNSCIKCSAVEDGIWNPHSFHQARTRSNSTHVEQTTRRPSGAGV